jgi:hypothetical protein
MKIYNKYFNKWQLDLSVGSGTYMPATRNLMAVSKISLL